MVYAVPMSMSTAVAANKDARVAGLGVGCTAAPAPAPGLLLLLPPPDSDVGQSVPLRAVFLGPVCSVMCATPTPIPALAVAAFAGSLFRIVIRVVSKARTLVSTPSTAPPPVVPAVPVPAAAATAAADGRAVLRFGRLNERWLSRP